MEKILSQTEKDHGMKGLDSRQPDTASANKLRQNDNFLG